MLFCYPRMAAEDLFKSIIFKIAEERATVVPVRVFPPFD